jgi:hypothetical protein
MMLPAVFSCAQKSPCHSRCCFARCAEAEHTWTRVLDVVRAERRPWLALVAAVSLLGCTEAVRLGIDRVGASGAGAAAGAGADGGAAGSSGAGGAGSEFPLAGAGGGDAGPAAPVDPGPCVPVTCGGASRQCGNCRDDDADGSIDASDPDCLGPCDDSERDLYSGTATRVTGNCRTDCYFDRNAGSGDDGCGWSYRCDPLSRDPDFFPTGSAGCAFDADEPSCNPSAAEVATCEQRCVPLTPNGCDCFGCCELPAHSDNYVWLGSESPDGARCELESSLDPELCKPCTPVPTCQNFCDVCELCVGKTELPAGCGGAPACPPGVAACDPGTLSGCGSLEYCITGCCVPLPT